MRALSILLPLLGAACGAPLAAPVETGADACGLDDAPFDPFGDVVQGASDDGSACVRVDRVPDDARRDTTWRATRLVAAVDGRAFDLAGDALTYENTHHNCLDVVRANGAALALTIDGVNGGDTSACFDPSSSAWLLVLELDGARVELLPHPR